MSQKDDKKVIEFPMDRVRPSEEKGEPRSVIFELENKRLMVSASIVSFLFLMTVINSSILSVNSEKQSEGRNIASTGSVAGLERNTSWERHLAESLSEGKFRDLASLGRKPTAAEKISLMFGSGYSILYSAGKVSEVEFRSDVAGETGDRVDTLEMSGKIISTDEIFSEDNLPLFPGSSAEPAEYERNEEGIRELVYLMDDGLRIGDVLIKRDSAGRLISLKVQTISSAQ